MKYEDKGEEHGRRKAPVQPEVDGNGWNGVRNKQGDDIARRAAESNLLGLVGLAD